MFNIICLILLASFFGIAITDVLKENLEKKWSNWSTLFKTNFSFICNTIYGVLVAVLDLIFERSMNTPKAIVFVLIVGFGTGFASKYLYTYISKPAKAFTEWCKSKIENLKK